MTTATMFRSKLYAAITFVLAAFSGYYTILAVFRDVLQAYYDINVAQFGLLLSVGMVPSAVASVVAGILVSHWGARRVMRASIVGLGIGALLAAFGQRWACMLVALALMASFYNALFVVSQAYLTALFPDNQRRVLSLYLAMTGVGGILFPLWAELLLHVSQPPSQITFSQVLHVPFGVLAVLMCCGALAFHRNAPDPRGGVKNAIRSWRDGLRISGGSVILLLSWIVIVTADIAVSTWMPRVLASRPLPDWLQPGYVMSAFMAVYVTARVILSFVPDRFGKNFLMFGPGMIGGAIFCFGVLMQDPVWIATSFVAGALGWSLQAPSILSALSKREGDGFGWTISLGLVAASLLGFVATYLMGIWGESLGEQRLWIILLVPAVGYPVSSLIALIWVAWNRRQNM